MTITVRDLIRLGLPKLLELLGFDDEKELAWYMADMGCPTLEDFVEHFMSHNFGLCSCCNDNYVDLEETDICYYCQELLYSKF